MPAHGGDLRVVDATRGYRSADVLEQRGDAVSGLLGGYQLAPGALCCFDRVDDLAELLQHRQPTVVPVDTAGPQRELHVPRRRPVPRRQRHTRKGVTTPTLTVLRVETPTCLSSSHRG